MACKVEFSVADKPEFHTRGWWAKGPEYFIEVLQQQLETAKAIWPELAQYELRKKSSTKAARGKGGGEARAAALEPERRSEIARIAANKRWGNTDPADHQ